MAYEIWHIGCVYSCRNATIGLTLLARRAGIQHASKATSISDKAITAKVSGSVELTPKSKLFITRVAASAITSPITTPEGRIYCVSAGKSFVVKAGEKPEILATNELNDSSPASPAVADGRIYLRGRKYLWCIGTKEESKERK